MCLFIVCESKFTIGESRTISHANDTQAQQVVPNPRPGSFPPKLLWSENADFKFSVNNERRRSQQETAEQKEHRLAQRRQRRQQETGTGDWNQRHYDRSLSKTQSLPIYVDQSLQSFSSVLYQPNNFQANCTGPYLFFVFVFF